MDWNRGYSAAYYMTIVDPDTWRDTRRIKLNGGSINRMTTDLRESADIDCEPLDEGYENWIRIWLDARQADDSVHLPIFTGLASSPGKIINGMRIESKLQCYSVLKPASDILLPRGWYAARDFKAGDMITKLLRSCKAPVDVQGETPRLSSYIIAEENETNLTMTNKILDAIGWRLRIEGDGTIQICPEAEEPSATFGTLRADCIEPRISVEKDLFECPNVFRAASGNNSVEVRDEDPDSALSTSSRKREVWKEESNITLFEGETLQSYAKRRLRELQRVSMTASYDRRYHPDVLPGDIVRINYPAQNLVGDFCVNSQKITLGHGVKTSEEVAQIRSQNR